MICWIISEMNFRIFLLPVLMNRVIEIMTVGWILGQVKIRLITDYLKLNMF